MDCTEERRRNLYSSSTFKQAFDDDSGTWWWWINIIGTLSFGVIGLIGNTICFLVVYRFALPQHSFVQYLRALAFFDFFALLFECNQSLNDLIIYSFSIKLLNFRHGTVCKLYEYFKYTVILLACWTIAALTFDRLILVCDPWSKIWPNLSRRVCNSRCAKYIIGVLICLALLINIPQLIFKDWICRSKGIEHTAAFGRSGRYNHSRNATNRTTIQVCSCRVSASAFAIRWDTYIYHLCCYTLVPAIILIYSNAAILHRLRERRQIVSQQNEHLRSKLTRTLTLVSLIFLIFYFPHAISQTLSDVVLSQLKKCRVILVLNLRIFKRLSELLNIAALGINFFLYILGVPHYRSAAIQMLGLHRCSLFVPYLTSEHRQSLSPSVRRGTLPENSSMKLLKVTASTDLNGASRVSVSIHSNNRTR